MCCLTPRLLSFSSVGSLLFLIGVVHLGFTTSFSVIAPLDSSAAKAATSSRRSDHPRATRNTDLSWVLLAAEQEDETPAAQSDGPFFTPPEETEEEQKEEKVIVSLENSVVPPPELPQPVRLDPLVASLTRMDQDTKDAPTMQVPIWGELILDRSLYLLVPAVLFAAIGFGMSLYIGLTSQDAVVAGLQQQAAESPEQATAVVAEKCRGLCSNQREDLQDLSNFMNSLKK